MPTRWTRLPIRFSRSLVTPTNFPHVRTPIREADPLKRDVFDGHQPACLGPPLPLLDLRRAPRDPRCGSVRSSPPTPRDCCVYLALTSVCVVEYVSRSLQRQGANLPTGGKDPPRAGEPTAGDAGAAPGKDRPRRSSADNLDVWGLLPSAFCSSREHFL